MVQNSLEEIAKVQKPGCVWQNFKHSSSLASEFVVDYLFYVEDIKPERKDHPGATLALKQLLSIPNECIAQLLENMDRVGNSCVRRVILSVGKIWSSHQWQMLVLLYNFMKLII